MEDWLRSLSALGRSILQKANGTATKPCPQWPPRTHHDQTTKPPRHRSLQSLCSRQHVGIAYPRYTTSGIKDHVGIAYALLLRTFPKSGDIAAARRTERRRQGSLNVRPVSGEQQTGENERSLLATHFASFSA